MNDLRERVIREYIDQHYPNARIVDYFDPDSQLSFYTADALAQVNENWFPICCYKDSKTKQTVYGGTDGIVHTYTQGETGSGKTTRFVMQSIYALSCMKGKPSMLISDIHGEIIENLYLHLINRGYTVKIINCDDPRRSDTYNPFLWMARDCREKQEITHETNEMIKRIAEIMQPNTSNSDRIWADGARSYINGCILDKFEDLIRGEISPENITLYNVIQSHYWLRNQLNNSYSDNLFGIEHFRNKPKNAISVQKMIGVTNNAEKTKACYFGVVENNLDRFVQLNMYMLSSNSTVDIDEFLQKPTVIVIQSGSTNAGDQLISLMINEIYNKVVKIGKKSKDKKLERNVHCFLDEFANCNVAQGEDFIKMLTTSRKFGMYWHMILQSDAQLERKFDAQIARIIRSNATEIYIGSQDYETQVRFAESCGKTTVESPNSVIRQREPVLEIIDLMTPEKLNTTKKGVMYVKMNRHPLLRTYIEAFYECDGFIAMENIADVYPVNDFDYTSTYEPIGQKKRTNFFTSEQEVDPFVVVEKKPAGGLFSGIVSAIKQDLLQTLSNTSQETIRNALSEFCMIPEFLPKVIDLYYSNDDDKENKIDEIFPISLLIIKKSIVEEYVKNNNFVKKTDWNKKITNDCEKLKNSNLLPKSLFNIFDMACREICEKMSLKDIKKLKKSIS